MGSTAVRHLAAFAKHPEKNERDRQQLDTSIHSPILFRCLTHRSLLGMPIVHLHPLVLYFLKPNVMLT